MVTMGDLASAVGRGLLAGAIGTAAMTLSSTLVHWGYGTAWGAVRGLLAGIGLGGCSATAVHFADIWGGSLVKLPALEVSPPASEMEPTELAIDAGHHLVYVVATALAYRALTD